MGDLARRQDAVYKERFSDYFIEHRVIARGLTSQWDWDEASHYLISSLLMDATKCQSGNALHGLRRLGL
jgi:hypothetical protein